MQYHALSCGTAPKYDELDFVATNSNDCKLSFKESMLSKRYKPSLSKHVCTVPICSFG